MFKLIASSLLLLGSLVCAAGQDRPRVNSQPSPTPVASTTYKGEFEYKLLATNRTTTMEKEMNIAAAEGHRFADVISGSTFFGGAEALVVMSRAAGVKQQPRYEYKLLATTKTSTMQKELQEAGDEGFEYCGQSVFKKTIGTEVMVILEHDRTAIPKLWDYKLLATKKTSTMQKEVVEAAAEGYQFVGFSSGSTFWAGNEVITIMRRPREQATTH